MAKVLGVDAGIGLQHKPDGDAHVFAGVGADWARPGIVWIVDPEVPRLDAVSGVPGVQWFQV
jgi:hypothetical protein